MSETESKLYHIIAITLGVEVTDLSSDTDITLDLNATPADLNSIKSQIEETFEVIIPSLTDDEAPQTLGELTALLEDALL